MAPEKTDREWIQELAKQHGCDLAEVEDLILRRARAAEQSGTLHLFRRHFEESHELQTLLVNGDKIGIEVPAPEGGEDDDHVVEARAALEEALRREELPTKTEVTAFSLGVGAASGAAIVATTASIVAILATWPTAWKNVKAWVAAIRRAVAGRQWYRMNVATLKLLCIDEVLRSHPSLSHLEPALISATVAMDTDPHTDEEETRGPVYVIVPITDEKLTYVFAIGWDGQIKERTSMPYVGPTREQLEEEKRLRSL